MRFKNLNGAIFKWSDILITVIHYTWCDNCTVLAVVLHPSTIVNKRCLTFRVVFRHSYPTRHPSDPSVTPFYLTFFQNWLFYDFARFRSYSITHFIDWVKYLLFPELLTRDNVLSTKNEFYEIGTIFYLHFADRTLFHFSNLQILCR